MSVDRRNFLIEKIRDICHVEIPRDLGKELILSWNEVKEMDNSGVAFGAHSVNHPTLTNIPLEQAKNEIIQSKRLLKKSLVKKSPFFLPSF